jgi:hypothetical protein
MPARDLHDVVRNALVKDGLERVELFGRCGDPDPLLPPLAPLRGEGSGVRG